MFLTPLSTHALCAGATSRPSRACSCSPLGGPDPPPDTCSRPTTCGRGRRHSRPRPATCAPGRRHSRPRPAPHTRRAVAAVPRSQTRTGLAAPPAHHRSGRARSLPPASRSPIGHLWGRQGLPLTHRMSMGKPRMDAGQARTVAVSSNHLPTPCRTATVCRRIAQELITQHLTQLPSVPRAVSSRIARPRTAVPIGSAQPCRLTAADARDGFTRRTAPH